MNIIPMSFTEDHLLYRAKNYEVGENIFAEVYKDYDDKFMYELYYNENTNLVLVAIQTEFFSLSSIEPIINTLNSTDIDQISDSVIYLGSGDNFYNLAINNKDIKVHSRVIDLFDIDYSQVSTIYQIFLKKYSELKKQNREVKQ